MKRHGTLVRWEKDRGFGFIRSPDIPADVFVHLRDFTDRRQTPQIGMKLTFEEIHVGGKGPRAVAVQATGRIQLDVAHSSQARRSPENRRHASPPKSSSMPMILLLLLYGTLLGHGIWTARIPTLALGGLLLLSSLTFALYGVDKNAAETGRWRIAENTLHLLSLIGGWPGAWMAQRRFRHKLRKPGFMAGYWFTVLAHIAAVGAWVGKLLPAL